MNNSTIPQNNSKTKTNIHSRNKKYPKEKMNKKNNPKKTEKRITEDTQQIKNSLNKKKNGYALKTMINM